MDASPPRAVETVADLRTVSQPPLPNVLAKAMRGIDQHTRRFIALSPCIGEFHRSLGDSSMRKTSILRRILNFLSAGDQKQKDREIGRLIARSGGRFTDELERRIEALQRREWL